MGPLLFAVGMLRQDVPDRVGAILHQVEFEAIDVREALRDLGRRGLLGITVAPDVQGTVTMSLREVPWEVALQNVTRQVDATYRFERGWLYVVRRPEESSAFAPDDTDGDAIEADRAFGRLRNAVAAGEGTAVRGLLLPDFAIRSATETRHGKAAIRSLIEILRAYPSFRMERTERRPTKGRPHVEFVLGYNRPGFPTIYYRDFWVRADGAWRLAAREETVRNSSRRFKDTFLSEVLKTLGEDGGMTLRLDPSLDRRVTVDLTGGTFETLLQELVQAAGLTYRLEGGVYQIVRRLP